VRIKFPISGHFPHHAPRLRSPHQKARQKNERDEIIDQLEAAEQQLPDANYDYELPPLDLLLESEEVSYEDHEKEVRRNANLLEKTFQNFGFNVKVVEIETGPVIAQYEIELEAGLRLAKITNLSDDLAIALRVPSVRIVAPIPGKNTVGIEVPNKNRQLVRLRDVIEEATHHTACPKKSCRRYPPHPGDAKAYGRCYHRFDQIEPAGTHRVSSRQPHG